jgi:hypothetical protein
VTQGDVAQSHHPALVRVIFFDLAISFKEIPCRDWIRDRPYRKKLPHR